MGAGGTEKAGAAGWVQGTWKTSSLHNRFRFVLYKLHSGSSGQGGTGRIKTRPGRKTTMGQDSDEHLHFDRRSDEHKDD